MNTSLEDDTPGICDHSIDRSSENGDFHPDDSLNGDNSENVKKSGCVCIPLAHLLKMSIPEAESILEPLITKQTVAMVYAWRGIGKSWFAMALACAVAFGMQFLKWKSSKKWRVLYIDGELPARVLQDRMRLIVNGFDGDIDHDSLHFITPDLQENGVMPNLSDPIGQAIIDEIAQGFDLIIVDNLSTLARSGKENEGESWLPIQGWALRHRAQGRAILFVHHSGKGGQQRGASRREDILDVVITLKRPPEYQSSDGAHFEVIFEKARHLSGDDAASLDVRLSIDEDKVHWDWKPAENTLIDRIELLIEEGATREEILVETGISSRFTLRRLVSAANENREKKIILPDSRKLKKPGGG